VKQLLSSKKALACIVGLVAVVLSMLLGKLGVSIPEDRVEEIVMLISAYVLGQGIADHGKEKEKAKAVIGTLGAPPSPPAV